MIPLVNNFYTKDIRLGRIPEFDERSRQFPIRQLIKKTAKPVTRSWTCYKWLDQGDSPACTGFSVSHEAAASPVVVPKIDNAVALNLYSRAKELDEWPGDDYDGSSVLGAIKAGAEKGWYQEYRWSFSIDDLILAVGHSGPAVLGLNWYEGMFDPDINGYLHPVGECVGGHAILTNNVNMKGRFFTLHNSWGKSWGINGEARISFDDLDRLLHEQGEACVPVRRGLGI